MPDEKKFLYDVVVEGRKEEEVNVGHEQTKFYLVVQEGGSSTEIYPHGFDTLKAAEEYRLFAAEAAYNTSEPVEVPTSLMSHPHFLNVVTEILRASVNMSQPG